MESLCIAATAYTPEINFTPSGALSLCGKSYPENTFEFYEPVLDWVQRYFQQSNVPAMTLNIELIYFNSSSSKLLFDLFDILDEHQKHEVTVNWIHHIENESAQEAGEDFIDDFEHLNIKLVVKQ